jgi:hypothetical protein
VADPAGNTAASQNFTGQNFSANQSRTYTLAFSPAVSGAFRVRVGVFSATWQEWSWNDSAANITVNSSLTFTSSATTTPSTLAPGSSSVIKSTVTDTGTSGLTNANVEVQVFNGSGQAVSTNVWSGQNFTGGQAQQYTYTWKVPSSQAAGSYTVMIGVFDGSWTTNYYWNSNGAKISIVVKPPAPTGLKATPGSGQVNLTWSASAGATSYNLYRGTTAGAQGTTPIARNINATSYTSTGLTNGIAYFYTVAAVNAAGTSPQSNEVTATPRSSQ